MASNSPGNETVQSRPSAIAARRHARRESSVLSDHTDDGQPLATTSTSQAANGPVMLVLNPSSSLSDGTMRLPAPSPKLEAISPGRRRTHLPEVGVHPSSATSNNFGVKRMLAKPAISSPSARRPSTAPSPPSTPPVSQRFTSIEASADATRHHSAWPGELDRSSLRNTFAVAYSPPAQSAMDAITLIPVRPVVPHSEFRDRQDLPEKESRAQGSDKSGELPNAGARLAAPDTRRSLDDVHPRMSAGTKEKSSIPTLRPSLPNIQVGEELSSRFQADRSNVPATLSSHQLVNHYLNRQRQGTSQLYLNTTTTKLPTDASPVRGATRSGSATRKEMNVVTGQLASDHVRDTDNLQEAKVLDPPAMTNRMAPSTTLEDTGFSPATSQSQFIREKHSVGSLSNSKSSHPSTPQSSIAAAISVSKSTPSGNLWAPPAEWDHTPDGTASPLSSLSLSSSGAIPRTPRSADQQDRLGGDLKTASVPLTLRGSKSSPVAVEGTRSNWSPPSEWDVQEPRGNPRNLYLTTPSKASAHPEQNTSMTVITATLPLRTVTHRGERNTRAVPKVAATAQAPLGTDEMAVEEVGLSAPLPRHARKLSKKPRPSEASKPSAKVASPSNNTRDSKAPTRLDPGEVARRLPTVSPRPHHVATPLIEHRPSSSVLRNADLPDHYYPLARRSIDYDTLRSPGTDPFKSSTNTSPLDLGDAGLKEQPSKAGRLLRLVRKLSSPGVSSQERGLDDAPPTPLPPLPVRGSAPQDKATSPTTGYKTALPISELNVTIPTLRSRSVGYGSPIREPNLRGPVEARSRRDSPSQTSPVPTAFGLTNVLYPGKIVLPDDRNLVTTRGNEVLPQSPETPESIRSRTESLLQSPRTRIQSLSTSSRSGATSQTEATSVSAVPRTSMSSVSSSNNDNKRTPEAVPPLPQGAGQRLSYENIDDQAALGNTGAPWSPPIGQSNRHNDELALGAEVVLSRRTASKPLENGSYSSPTVRSSPSRSDPSVGSSTPASGSEPKRKLSLKRPFRFASNTLPSTMTPIDQGASAPRMIRSASQKARRGQPCRPRTAGDANEQDEETPVWAGGTEEASNSSGAIISRWRAKSFDAGHRRGISSVGSLVPSGAKLKGEFSSQKSDLEKDRMWEELLQKSDRAGGTLHATLSGTANLESDLVSIRYA